jgi:hypothetical protein
MGWLRNIAKYLPYAWIGIKVLWQMYKANIRQEAFRDALRNERKRRLDAEREMALRDRLDDSVDERRERILREAREAAERGD